MANTSPFSLLSQATHALADVAQAGLQRIKSVAAAALGSRAGSTATVAMRRSANALVSRGARLKKKAYGAAKAAGKVAHPLLTELPRFVTKSVSKKRTAKKAAPSSAATSAKTSERNGDS
jgi:hypothetical protein